MRPASARRLLAPVLALFAAPPLLSTPSAAQAIPLEATAPFGELPSWDLASAEVGPTDGLSRFSEPLLLDQPLLAAPDAPESLPVPSSSGPTLKSLLGSDLDRIPAAKAQELMAKLGMNRDQLIAALLETAKELSRPMFGIPPIGAVGVGASGDFYLGGFILLPMAQTIHAEQGVLLSARRHGETKLVELYVTDLPCGPCRQFLHEMGADESLVVAVPGQPRRKLSELLPSPYQRAPGKLLAPAANGLAAGQGDGTELFRQAVQAANEAHVPYSKTPSGVAIRMKDGTFFRGPLIEMPVANVTILALPAALADLAAHGGAYSDIAEVLLVETGPYSARQDVVIQTVLQTIAPQAVFRKASVARP